MSGPLGVRFACVWFGYLVRLDPHDPECVDFFRACRAASGKKDETPVDTLPGQEYALRDWADAREYAVQWVGQGLFALSIKNTGRITYNHPIELGQLAAPAPVAALRLKNDVITLSQPHPVGEPQWHLAVG